MSPVDAEQRKTGWCLRQAQSLESSRIPADLSPSALTANQLDVLGSSSLPTCPCAAARRPEAPDRRKIFLLQS